MKTVFISSIQRDFDEVREGARKAVESLGMHAVMAETMGASPESPQRTLLDEVRELTYAIYSGSPMIVRRLLEAGADPHQVDGEGKTLHPHVNASGSGGLAKLLWPRDEARGT